VRARHPSGGSALEWVSALYLRRTSPLPIYSVTAPTPSPNEARESLLVIDRWSESRVPTNCLEKRQTRSEVPSQYSVSRLLVAFSSSGALPLPPRRPPRFLMPALTHLASQTVRAFCYSVSLFSNQGQRETCGPHLSTYWVSV
jgi:hypothetical protein